MDNLIGIALFALITIGLLIGVALLIVLIYLAAVVLPMVAS